MAHVNAIILAVVVAFKTANGELVILVAKAIADSCIPHFMYLVKNLH